MLTYDFSPLLRTAIGFDRLARQVEMASRFDEAAAYPPYNIESAGEDQYRITLAVAGFTQSELTLEVKENALTITGHKADKVDESGYLHRGIATRDFVRRFQLADHVLVTNANLSDGLLTIDLVREVPEEKKPRQIQIKSEAPASLIDKAKKLIEGTLKKDAA